MVGSTILHYTVLAELGAGGMGRVYLARDQRTDRKVALKFLGAPETATAEERERLTREARAVARLSHPGVVALHAIEETPDQVFLVQEFVEGESLARRLESGPLSAPEVQRLARELTAALAHAHSHGVLHRDLKPDNVLIDPTGAFKIADFGIAHLEGVTTLTRAGTVMGSLPYMAPERLAGNPGDARADLFALGAVLYEAMSGRRAFGGRGEAEVMYTVMHEPPAPLETAASLRPLADLALRLLAKEARERPASAEVVAGILEGLDPSRARSASRRRVSRWIPVAAAGALIAIAALLLWRRGREGAAAGPPAVAVLAFENVAEPSDPGRMGPITANLLNNSLAQTADLNVLSAQRILDAIRQMGRHAEDLDRSAALAVARRARARRIVTGSILQIQPTIVMTAEVSDVESGKVLQAARIEGQPGQSVFQVVDALSGQLLQRMVRAAEITRLAPVAARTSGDLEAQRDYADGLAALSAGRFDEALAAFQRAVGRDSTFAQAQFQLAIAEWWSNEPADAKASIVAARALSDRLSPLERSMVEALDDLVRGRWTAASEKLARLEKEYPNEKLVRYGQVEASYHGARYAQAIEAAHRTLALDPDFALAGIHLVDALRDSRHFDEAESEGRRLLAVYPKNAVLWRSLAAVMRDRGDRDGMLRVAKEAEAAGAVSASMTGDLLVLQFNRIRKLDVERVPIPPGRAPWMRTNLRLAIEYARALRRGRFREAENVAARAWRLQPLTTGGAGPPIPAASGMEAAAAAGDTARALAWADSAGARLDRWLGRGFPVSRRSNELWVEARLGRAREARAILGWMESQSPGVGDSQEFLLRFCRAEVLEAEGRHREALEAIRGAAWPGEPWCSFAPRLLRARILAGAGLYPEALTTVDTLIDLPFVHFGDAVRLHFYRGQMLEQLHRPAEAAACYREFLALWKDADPGTPEVTGARAALAKLERAAVAVPAGGAKRKR